MDRGLSGRYEIAQFEREQVQAFIPSPLSRTPRLTSPVRAAGSVLRVHTAFRERPILFLSDICQHTGLSFPAATNGMALLARLYIVRELTGRQRNRLFVYDRYLQILSEGTEPL